jgi:dTDP-4-amino-4,6-dideoxygalactose transaminase
MIPAPTIEDPITLVDLKLQNEEVAEDIAEGWARVVARSDFIEGEAVQDFEREFARFSDIAHCVGVANGTDALELALRAIGVGRGDEVVLPANTFIATAEAVMRTGAVPVVVDADPDFHLIDPEKVADAIGPRTKAVIPVHLYGQMAPMAELLAITEDRGIHIVEDAAQAQGASQRGVSPGGYGVAAGTSFYPGKNLGAYGDAGGVLTNLDHVAARIRRLRNHGSPAKYQHPELGFNSRLDTLQAVVLSAKLTRLNEWNRLRSAAAELYGEMLQGFDDVSRPKVLPGNVHVWHLYVVRVPKRDAVLSDLKGRGIHCGIHYPTPIHLEGAMREFASPAGSMPVAEETADQILSLPMFPGITPDQQERVVEGLKRSLG